MKKKKKKKRATAEERVQTPRGSMRASQRAHLQPPQQAADALGQVGNEQGGDMPASQDQAELVKEELGAPLSTAPPIMTPPPKRVELVVKAEDDPPAVK